MLDMSLTLTPGTPESTAIDASPLLSPMENLSILVKKNTTVTPLQTLSKLQLFFRYFVWNK